MVLTWNMELKTRLRLVSIVIAAFTLGLIFAYCMTLVKAKEGTSSGQDHPDLDYKSEEFRAWCFNFEIQKDLPQTYETFPVSGDCRKTQDADGSWSLNCNLTPDVLPLPLIQVAHATAVNPTSTTCKSTAKGHDTYKFGFRYDAVNGKVRSTLTHYKLKESGEKKIFVHWSNLTQMTMEITPIRDSKLVTDGRLEVDVPEPEVVEEPMTESTDVNRTKRTSRLVTRKDWNRTKCSAVLPECDSEE